MTGSDHPDGSVGGPSADGAPGSVFADAAPLPDVDTSGPGEQGCAGVNNCYTVYAHSNDTLYLVDLMAKSLSKVGPFKSTDTITDLAVMPDGTIYAISKTNLYTVSPTTGNVSLVSAVTTCGKDNVALTATPDGKLFAADYNGAFCQIDITQSPPTVTPIGSGIGMGMAISGDIVTVDDGTMFGTAYYLADASGTKSQLNNLLVTLDPSTGMVKQVIGQTGFPKLYGVSYALGQVFGFTHDGTGRVITIDITSGAGTLYATFKDSSNNPISFAGAAVNPMVPKIIN